MLFGMSKQTEGHHSPLSKKLSDAPPTLWAHVGCAKVCHVAELWQWTVYIDPQSPSQYLT